MLRKVILFAICLSLTTAINAQIQESAIDTNALHLIQETLLIYPVGTQFSMGQIKAGKVTFSGFKNLGDSIVSVQNQDHVFEIGSISKVYTSTLLAQLISEDILEADQPIINILPYILRTDSTITCRQLANHTSGLPRMPSNFLQEDTNPLNPFLAYDSEALGQYLTIEMVLDSTPGSTYSYSNLGVGLLGFLIQHMEDKELADIFVDRIFKPLKMTNTAISRHDISAPRVDGQTAQGLTTHPWDFDVLAGAGAIVSSAEDQTKFMLDQLRDDNPLVPIMTEKPFQVSEGVRVGLGWHLIDTQSGIQALWHNGATSGYTSSLAIDRENQNGIVILTNVSAYHPEMGKIDELNNELMELMGK